MELPRPTTSYHIISYHIGHYNWFSAILNSYLQFVTFIFHQRNIFPKLHNFNILEKKFSQTIDIFIKYVIIKLHDYT